MSLSRCFIIEDTVMPPPPVQTVAICSSCGKTLMKGQVVLEIDHNDECIHGGGKMMIKIVIGQE